MPEERVGSDYWPDQSEMVYHMPFLEEMASKASVIVEIGVGHGNGSTRAFERGLKRTTHPNGAKLFVSVDDNPNKPDVKPTIECWHKITSDSRAQEAVNGCNMLRIASGVYEHPVDILYIDTEHTYEHMKAELEVWFPLMTKETILLAHDTHMFSNFNEMTNALLELCSQNPRWEYIQVTEESHGLGMVRWRDNAL